MERWKSERKIAAFWFEPYVQGSGVNIAVTRKLRVYPLKPVDTRLELPVTLDRHQVWDLLQVMEKFASVG